VVAGAAVNEETIMDTLNFFNRPGVLALDPLCQGAAQELLMRSYIIRTVNRYKRVREPLADFACAQGQPTEYSPPRRLGHPWTAGCYAQTASSGSPASGALSPLLHITAD
jgi:hypothetical protein